jgi:prophage antirepressor-like protein
LQNKSGFQEIFDRVLRTSEEPLFLAKDVCGTFGISNFLDAVAPLDADMLVSVKATSGG